MFFHRLVIHSVEAFERAKNTRGPRANKRTERTNETLSRSDSAAGKLLGTQIAPFQASISPVFNFEPFGLSFIFALARQPGNFVPRSRGHFKKYLRSAGSNGSANSYLFFLACWFYLHGSSGIPRVPCASPIEFGIPVEVTSRISAPSQLRSLYFIYCFE